MIKRNFSLSLLIASAVPVLLFSCSKNSNPSPPAADSTTVTYAITNVGGAYPSQTSYVQGLADLNITKLDNSNATEASSFSSQWAYHGAVYLSTSGAPATLSKYTFDKTGKAVLAGKLVVPGSNTFSSIEFVSDTLAYGSVGGGLAELVKFNPTALQITGQVDLSPLAKPDGAFIYYLGMKARDGKLFMGVQYFDAGFDYLVDSAFIAVIDLASNKVQSLLSDGRTSNIFLAGSSVSGFAEDGSGDLYIQGQGSGNTPSGILRIKKGATTFDPGYFFNLKTATGKDCSGLYILNGLAFTTQLQDASDAYESIGPEYRYYKLDLADMKSLGDLSASLPNIYGSSSSIMRSFDSQNILFSVSSTSVNAIYSYSIVTGAVTPKITMTSGICTGLDKIR